MNSEGQIIQRKVREFKQGLRVQRRVKDFQRESRNSGEIIQREVKGFGGRQ